jgi:MFS family permease
LPAAVAAPFTGLLADRHSRRTVLLWLTAMRAVLLIAGAATVAAGLPLAVVLALAGAFTASLHRSTSPRRPGC